MKIDIKRLNKYYKIEVTSELFALAKARDLIYFLQHHSKNMTKEQRYKIDDLAAIIDCMKA